MDLLWFLLPVCPQGCLSLHHLCAWCCCNHCHYDGQVLQQLLQTCQSSLVCLLGRLWICSLHPFLDNIRVGRSFGGGLHTPSADHGRTLYPWCCLVWFQNSRKVPPWKM